MLLVLAMRSSEIQTYNKQFKSDSPRLAFLVWVQFSVYGVQFECSGSVAHTLIGRYANEEIKWIF